MKMKNTGRLAVLFLLTAAYALTGCGGDTTGQKDDKGREPPYEDISQKEPGTPAPGGDAPEAEAPGDDAQDAQASGGDAPEAEAPRDDTKDPEAPQDTAEDGEYPKLQSRSGEYHDYGTYVIRVDDSAFELYSYVDKSAAAYAEVVDRVAEKLAGQTTVYDLAIPTAIGVVLPDDIAAILPNNPDQGKAIEKIFDKLSDKVVPVNCYDNMMRHRDEYLYFRTDFHWNGRGAYYAYESFCQAKGIEPIPLEDRKEVQFDNFLGQLYWGSSRKDPILGDAPDTVYAYYPASENATMEYTDKNGSTVPWKIISDVSGWASSTKYSTFAGADNPVSRFQNPDVTDGSVCVIVKESYGNALLPYLVDHYSTVYEIDYRYWKGDLAAFALENHATDLIFANNLTMISSGSLVKQLASLAK